MTEPGQLAHPTDLPSPSPRTTGRARGLRGGGHRQKAQGKGQETARRKPDLRPVALAEHSRSIDLTPWQVLHDLARGYVLAGQGMGRGLAEHWLSLKFCEALDGNRAGSMDLTDKGRSSESWYKGMQARELAVGFGLAGAVHNEEVRELWNANQTQAHPDGDVRRFRLPHHEGHAVRVRITAFSPLSSPYLRFVVLLPVNADM